MMRRLSNALKSPAYTRLAVLIVVGTVAIVFTGATSQSQQAACKCFVPEVSATYSTTAPGSNPDIFGTLSIGLGPDGQYGAGQGDDTNDYNFGGIVNFSPNTPADAAIPNAALVGSLQTTATLGLLNNPCANRVEVPFQFMESSTDINDVVDMLPFGTGNELGPMSGDNPPFDGNQAVKPPPLVTQYPAFLNAIFDHDWVDYGADRIPGNADDNNGPSPPIRPRFRAAAATWLSFASLWVVLQQVVFEPGTDLPNLPPFDPAHGYPSVTVLQTSSAAGSATPPLAGPITDFCTPLHGNGSLPGVTGDNPDTAPNEAGVPLRTLPNQPGTPVRSIFYTFSQRDADGDGYESTLDTCPFTPDTVWNPRSSSRAGDSDTFFGSPAPDGIPDTCDPTPNEPSGQQPTDHDNDGFPNSGDNCPLIANPAQQDSDRNAQGEVVGDGVGDACDPNPLTPDGNEIVCIRTVTIIVGGSTEASVSECLQSFPAPSTPTPTPTPEPSPAPQEAHDARAVRIKAPKSINLSADGSDTGRVEVTVENEGEHLETVGIYVDIAAPPDGGCQPSGRLRGTSISLDPGDRRTLTIDGYPGDPVPGDGLVTFLCNDPLPASGLNYTISVAVDAHVDDAVACPPGAIQSLSCFNALADDDNHSSDNRLGRPGPVVRW